MESGQKEIFWRDGVQKRKRAAIERLHSLKAVVPKLVVRNVNELIEDELSVGDRVAIWVAERLGSWPFIIGLAVFLGGWVVLNAIAWERRWDPYPFILMNLLLSLEAAFTGPLIMMAQNRQAEKDRLMLQQDFETNRQAVEDIRRVLDILEEHGHLLELLFEEQIRPPHKEAEVSAEHLTTGKAG